MSAPRGNTSNRLPVALAQIAPVWLDRAGTTAKVAARVSEAASRGAGLVVFGEALVPGYPFWVEHTEGARFESPLQKELYARYLEEGVEPEAGHLDPVRKAAADGGIAVYLGVMERAQDRGRHSLYASLVHIDAGGVIRSVHRKLVPTHEERLVWAAGDGHGLRVHRLGAFTAGGLNCWENWMPLARAALYGQGEDLHVAVWPGSARNTRDITRFIARESRSYVVSVSGFLRREDVPEGFPARAQVTAALPEMPADGGSCVAGPDGAWILEPVMGREALEVVELDPRRVREERQNFDPAGHYARPDVTRLVVRRTRQSTVSFRDDPA